MTTLDEKKAFHALRKIYSAAEKVYQKGRGVPAEFGEYRFFWDEPNLDSGNAKKGPIRWSFEISCRIAGQSLWDGHIEEYHLHDVIAAQYKSKEEESYRWLQWETRFPESRHEFYLDELLIWASDTLGNEKY